MESDLENKVTATLDLGGSESEMWGAKVSFQEVEGMEVLDRGEKNP